MIQAFGTKWGLFKYYWIVVKLVLTAAMTGLLLLHLGPIGQLAGMAPNASKSSVEVESTFNLIQKAALALLALLATTTISIYKPWGRIGGGNMDTKNPKMKKPTSYYVLVAVVIFFVVFIVLHLLGGGMRGH
ncbi:MAG: hypothetical protein EOP49_00005 [Sphingobacteriales bacterium]|nr:MAG: hypothetical protein EOP49_00005 [Sphingobacteriales bacterium]